MIVEDSKGREISVRVTRDRGYFVLTVYDTAGEKVVEAARAELMVAGRFNPKAELCNIKTKIYYLPDGTEVDFRGKGYGGALLKCAAYIAQKNGCQFLNGRFNGDENAVKMYRSYGFKFYKGNVVYDGDDNQRIENCRELQNNEDPCEISLRKDNSSECVFVNAYTAQLSFSKNHGIAIECLGDNVSCERSIEK